MNDMERRKFEDSFKDAFEDAQLTPTENVWTNIELDLERASGDNMKRRLLFFKLLAAASIAFAMAVAGVGYYAYNMQTQELIAQRGSGDKSQQIQPSSTDHSVDQPAIAQSSSSESEPSADENASGQTASNKSQELASPSMLEYQKESDAAQLALKPKGATDANNPGNIESTDASKSLASQTNRGKQNRNSGVAPDNAQQKDGLAVAANGKETTLNPTAKRTPLAIAAQSDPGKQNRNSEITRDNAQQKDAALVAANNQEKSSTPNEAYSVIPGVSGKANSFALDNTTRKPSTFFVPENAKVPAKQESTADPFMLMMARLDDEAKAMNTKAKKSKKDFSGEQLWTSVGMTAGQYSTVNRSISSEMQTNALQTASSQVKAAGVAYSFGVSVGTKIAERWVVQGGVNYLNQMSDYTSTIIVGGNVVGQFNAMNGTTAAVLADETKAQFSSRNDTGMNWAKTPPFGVTNTMEFVSIPVEAGYMVVNKKVGVMVNAGVSTDLFIQNTESANVDGAVDPVQTQERGSSDSPFRDLNFIGLVGTEVSYKVGTRYRVALTPGLRYPFNSMYKDDSRIQATPVTFDVGLKFRYIFQ